MWFLLPALALAGDAISLSAVRKAQQGFGAPTVTFHSSVTGRLAVRVRCSEALFRLDEPITPGTQHVLELAGLPIGVHACSGTVGLGSADGSVGEMPLELEVEVLAPLRLEVDRSELDLDQRVLTVRGSRPLKRVEVTVLGEHGDPIGQGSTSIGAVAGLVEWDQSGAEAVKLVLTAWDLAELPATLELFPWSYAIPHEDVHFASGKHEVSVGEQPKLEAAWTELTQVIGRYGDVVEVALFVVGYTDTVGAAEANRALSERRARAIAHWFRTRGFEGSIAYQGFGESVLAVSTPDETDEPGNRRALYLLAAEAPGISSEVPAAQWTPLD